MKQRSDLPLVFLEAHNIQNRNKGLGVFNYQLIKAMSQVNTDYRLMVNMADKGLMGEFDSPLVLFHRYREWQRHALFRIRKRADVWHSLNQNIKVEPHHRLPYVLTIHDTIGLETNAKGLSRLRDKVARSWAITYISEAVRQQTHQLLDLPSHVREYVIYNGNPITTLLDTSSFVPVEMARRPYIYAIGDFQERKNFHALIDMMRLETDLCLIISGQTKSPYAERIRQMIASYGLGDRVCLTGVVSEEGKQYYMRHAEAFVFPSTEEGFGLPIIEAMKFGKPVLLSPLSCIPEIGGEDAYYFDGFEPEQMLRSLHHGLEHYQAHSEEVSAKMRARADRFTWERAARAYLGVYADLLGLSAPTSCS